MIHFVFDLTQISDNTFVKNHGGKTYALTLLERIFNLTKCSLTLVCKTDEILSEIPDSILKSKRVDIDLSNDSSDSNFWTKYDNAEGVIFFPLPYHLLNTITTLKTAKVVFVIHGLRSLEMWSDHYKILYKRNIFEKFKSLVYIVFQRFFKKRIFEQYKNLFSSLNTNHIILTDSMYSINSIKFHFPNTFNSKTNNIHLLYPFIDDNMVVTKTKKTKKQFILMVSGNRYEKNVLRYIDALHHIGHPPTIEIVVTGCDPWFSQMLDTRYKESNIRLKTMNYVSNFKLKELYQSCSLFVYPSLHEGFGLPIIEALSHGASVLASSSSSIPEAGGNVINYLNPLDPIDMAVKTFSSLNSTIPMKEKEKHLKSLAAASSASIKNLLLRLSR